MAWEDRGGDAQEMERTQGQLMGRLQAFSAVRAEGRGLTLGSARSSPSPSAFSLDSPPNEMKVTGARAAPGLQTEGACPELAWGWHCGTLGLP